MLNRYFVPARPTAPTKEQEIARQLNQQQPVIIDQNKAAPQKSAPSKLYGSLAQNALAQGSSTAPVQSVGEGIARALQGITGGYLQSQYEDKQKSYDAAKSKALIDALSSGKSGNDLVKELSNQGFASDAAAYAQKNLDEQAKSAAQLQLEEGKYKLGNQYLPQRAALTIQAETPAKVAQAQALNPVEAQGAAMKAQATIPYDLAKASAGRSVNNVTVNAGKDIASQVGDVVKASYQKAQAAQTKNIAADKILQGVQNGGIVTGAGANTRLNLLQLGSILGVADKDTQQTILNTRQAIQGLAQLGVSARAQLQGQGAISQAESEAVQKAESGDINSLTPQELVYVANVAKKAAALDVSNHQRLLGTVESDPNTKGLGKFFEVNPLPQEPQQPVSSPAGALKRNPDGSYSYGF